MDNLELLKNEDGVIYTLQKNEDLKSVAELFNTTEKLIIEDNFLSSNVYCGCVLYVKPCKKIHIVEVEDTIESISTKYGISIDKLLYINKIEYIYISQRLKIE